MWEGYKQWEKISTPLYPTQSVAEWKSQLLRNFSKWTCFARACASVASATQATLLYDAFCREDSRKGYNVLEAREVLLAVGLDIRLYQYSARLDNAECVYPTNAPKDTRGVLYVPTVGNAGAHWLPIRKLKPGTSMNFTEATRRLIPELGWQEARSPQLEVADPAVLEKLIDDRRWLILKSR
jgi:hypothetical protein